MPYASVSDVKALAPNVPISNMSQPSEGIVATWIADQERVLNALFASMGFVTPLTGPVAQTIAKDLVTHYVMARVMRARPNPETDPASFQQVYDSMMKRLRDPQDPFTLVDAETTPDATVKNLGPRFSSFLRDRLTEVDDLEPRITRDQVF